MARPPSAASVLRNTKKRSFEPKSPIATDMFLPNHSGDHSAGHTNIPTQDKDIVNKEYTDDTFLKKTGGIISGNLNVQGELQGSRAILHFGDLRGSAVGDTRYLYMAGNGLQCSGTKGYVMPRDGSIVGYSVRFTTGSFSFAGAFRSRIYRNRITILWAIDTPLINSNGEKAHYATQARGTDTFSAGDLISIDVNALYIGGYSNVELLLEIQLDD